MPVVRFRHDRSQILVKVAILPPSLDPEPWRFEAASGLVDTGASFSGVSGSIARELNLPRRGKEIITTPGGEHVARLFQFRVGIYLGQDDAAPHDHRATEADLVRIGRDIEARVLARAVHWTAERRVFVNGNRTVVFR